MKKRILGAILSAAVLSLSALTAFAAEAESSVTLNKKSVLVYEDSDVNVNIVPGESFVQTINIKNEYKLTSDFYMSANVVRDLEESVEAAGAGYDVKLEVINKDNTATIYDSTVGGEGTAVGLSTVDLQDTMLIATLAKGESASVVLTIDFDGEGLDNTEIADYANSFANLNFDFQAGYEEPTGETVEEKVVTQPGTPQYVTIEETVVPMAAQTGDSLLVPVVIAAVLLAGIALVVIGRKKSAKAASTVIAGAAAFLILSMSTSAMADDVNDTYTVTFRPGAVGTFTTNADDYKALENVKGVEVTANGAIKIKVLKNSAMPSFPAVTASEGYVENTNWRADATDVVTKNVDFVADYAKLVNGVEYTILYVDAETGDSVYQPYTALGNVGDEIIATLPTSITISDAALYYPVSGQKATLVLDADSANNVLTIQYQMEARTNVENVTVVYVNGEIVTTVVPVTAPAAAVTPAAGGAAAPTGPAAPAAEEEVTIEEEETPLAPGVEEGGDITIEEEDTPLASGIGSEDVTIEDEETPLAPGFEEASNWPYIAGVLAVLAVVAAFLFVALRKKAVVTNSDNNEQ